ncbi:MAG: carbon-nitrogen hydrolase family protein [Armatimonadota bacterium]|nr:carbon-nitrogen hydrolase family protein [Armatimonadota bacterium]
MNNTIVVFVLTLALLAGNPAYSAGEKTGQPTTDAASGKKLNIALLQMASIGEDQAANMKKADEFCRKAAGMGADIALMPEMWNIGYGNYGGKTREDRGKWEAKAVSRDSDYVRHFASLAKELNMAIVVTYLEKWPKAPRNSATLIDHHGKQVFTYAKVHTCDFAKREAACTPGDGFKVGELDTAAGKLAVGMMICYDREFPESARVLMLKGAELILTPNACTLGDLRITEFQIRAYENATAVAMANYPSGHPGCNGQSVVFDARGMPLVRANGAEGISMASIDIAAIREHRKSTIWGGAFRRPHQYKDLLKDSKEPVFERNNAFDEKFVSRER